MRGGILPVLTAVRIQRDRLDRSLDVAQLFLELAEFFIVIFQRGIQSRLIVLFQRILRLGIDLPESVQNLLVRHFSSPLSCCKIEFQSRPASSPSRRNALPEAIIFASAIE